MNVAALDAQHKTNDAREKQRVVASGGGDEGAIYLAYRHNVEAYDGKAILDQMSASMKSAIVETMHTGTARRDHSRILGIHDGDPQRQGRRGRRHT